MKHIATIFLAIVFLTTAGNSYAQDAGSAESKPAESKGAEPVGLSFGVDYTSTYLWRGTYWYNGDGAFFPSVSFEKGGLSVGYTGEYSEDKVTRKDTEVSNPDYGIGAYHAADFGVNYSHSIGDAATIGVGVWYFHFYNEKTLSFYTGTVSLSLDKLPLTPTLAYNHDYYTDSGDKKDYYITLGLSKGFEIKDAGLSIGVTAGYYNSDSCDTKGFSDITTSLGVEASYGAVKFSGSFNYVFVPSKDYYEATIYTGTKDKHRTYANFGASVSL